MTTEQKKKYDKKWREENKEYFKEYNKKNRDKINKQKNNYCEKNKKKVIETNKKWRKANPIKQKEITKRDRIKNRKHYQARNLANRFIKIPKGYLCEICNKELAKERHHKDYNKPLSVDLVCIKCHIKLDRRIKYVV